MKRRALHHITVMGEDALLTPAEACELLKVSRPTLRRYSEQGIVPAVRFEEGKKMRRYRLGTLRAVVRQLEERTTV